MLSPRGQHVIETKIFGLGFVLMQCWSHSHEVCPRGLVVSHGNQVIQLLAVKTRACMCVAAVDTLASLSGRQVASPPADLINGTEVNRWKQLVDDFVDGFSLVTGSNKSSGPASVDHRRPLQGN